MSPNLRKILESGVSIELVGDDRLKAHGVLTDQLRALIRDNKGALVAELATSPYFRWRIARLGQPPSESCFSPEATRAEVAERFPGAIVFPLLPEPEASK